MEKVKQKPTTGFAFLTLGTIIVFMGLGLLYFKVKLETMMLLSWMVFFPFALKLGYSFNDLEKSAFEFVKKSLQTMGILIAVGALIGTWITAGTVPTIIYYGLQVISPQFFLVATLFLCSIVSMATGTSWGTMGTAGIAMMGVGAGLGIPGGMTAGAVICGAYFGDKMSPLSDSTNLAAAVAGTNIFKHVKHMWYTTVPSYIITTIIFLVIGAKYGSTTMDFALVNEYMLSIKSVFKIGLIPLIPAVLVMYLLARGKNPIMSITSGAIAGLLVAVLYQGQTITFAASSVYAGYKGTFDSQFLTTLLNRGGITSMLGLMCLLYLALGLGGMMRDTGMLEAILNSFKKNIKSTGSLVATTLAVSYINNCIGASQSFAAVMTGTLMAPLFEERKLKEENLSRILEDAGTLGAPLIPWNSNAVFAMSVLQIDYASYIPYCFLNFINPVISLIYGITGFSMTKYTDVEITNRKKAVEVGQ